MTKLKRCGFQISYSPEIKKTFEALIKDAGYKTKAAYIRQLVYDDLGLVINPKKEAREYSMPDGSKINIPIKIKPVN